MGPSAGDTSSMGLLDPLRGARASTMGDRCMKLCKSVDDSINFMKKNATASYTAGGQEIVATAADFDEHGALTRDFLLRRGQCCQEGCHNCPYGFPPQGNPTSRPRTKRS